MILLNEIESRKDQSRIGFSGNKEFAFLSFLLFFSFFYQIAFKHKIIKCSKVLLEHLLFWFLHNSKSTLFSKALL